MTVYLPKDCKSWRYTFVHKGKRYAGSTGQLRKADALKWEENAKLTLRRQLGGLEPVESPRFSDWAEIYYDQVATGPRAVTRPDRVEFILRVVLRFWGAKPSGRDPKNRIVEGEPYHDLRLADAIADPDHIVAFEDWMTARGIAGQTRNQYRSTLRQMYQLALQPRWRKKTGIQTNPFDGIYRDRPGARTVTTTPDELRRVLAHASYHVRLAVAIGALAPKLRLGNILALRWSVHVDPGLTFITMHEHKTAAATGRPLVIPIAPQLQRILAHARRRSATSDYVVTYHGQPIQSLRGGLRAACEAAGVPYGRFTADGATFHTLRHTAATILAELDVGEQKRQAVMGHQHLATTQRYTHLRPVSERAPLELLSTALPMEDLVTARWTRATRKKEKPDADETV